MMNHSNFRVAVVDDDTTLLGMINELLSEEGFIVNSFTDGEQLKKAVYHNRFDVIVTDINMPEVSGIELLRYLREVGSKAEVIVMTANAQVDTAIEAVRLGAFDYLKKPFDNIEDVVSHVRRAAEKILMGRRQDNMVRSVIEKTKQLLAHQHPGADLGDIEALLATTEKMVKGLQATSESDGEKRLTGAIQEIGLPNLLQMLGLVGKPGILKMGGPGWEGEIWFASGRIVHSSCGRVKGEKAVFRLLEKEKGQFHFILSDAVPPESEISTSTDGVILDCLRRIDEYRKLGPRVPPSDLCLRLQNMTAADLSKEDQLTLELIMRYSRVGEILDYSPLHDLETVKSLIRLRMKGLLDIYYPA